MKLRIAVALYLVHWYAFAVSGVMLALQAAPGPWLASLPWTSWGTELADGLTRGEPVSGGAAWIALGALLAILGVCGSVVASLSWLARQADAASGRDAASSRSRAAPDTAATWPVRAREATDLVEDPQVRRLIQQLNTRLG